MNWWDKLLMGLVIWIMRGWFSRSVVGYDANDNVVYLGFSVDYFVDTETQFVEYERK